MINNLLKIWAFIKRDFLSEVSYRLAFVMQVAGMFFTLLALFFFTKMVDPQAEGLNGVRPFDWVMMGLAFQFYFSTALYSFSAKIRSEQLLGTLEVMLVSPTRAAPRQSLISSTRRLTVCARRSSTTRSTSATRRSSPGTARRAN